MKLILLRHEERYYDIGFFSNLTDNGIVNSCLLPDKLKNLNIDVIFSSPFTRTLQTIYPYCKKYNKKINLEYGLYEYIHNPYFLFNSWYYTKDNIEDKDLVSVVNNNYESIVKKDDFIILEDEINLEKRIIKFFSFLNMFYNNNTVLIVSHKGIINKIKDLYIKKTSMDEDFSMGHFEIYDI